MFTTIRTFVKYLYAIITCAHKYAIYANSLKIQVVLDISLCSKGNPRISPEALSL